MADRDAWADALEPNPATPSGFAVAGQVFGLFAGIATILYVVGGVVIGLRLWYADLPVWSVVNQLPRELLITEALVYIAVPFALTAATYMGVPSFNRMSARPATLQGWLIREERTGHIYTLVGLVVVVVVAAIMLLRGDIFKRGFDWGAASRLLLLLTVLTNLTALLIAVSLRLVKRGWADEEMALRREKSARAAAKEGKGPQPVEPPEVPDLPGVPKLLLDGSSWALAFLPVFIAIGSTVPFPWVKGCGVKASYGRVGQLISHSSDTLYMGVDDHEASQRLVVAIPMGRLEEALIASEGKTDSDPEPETAPKCDPVANNGSGGGGGFGGGDFGGGGASGDW